MGLRVEKQRAALPSARLRRGMPELVPLLLIGRLSIDRDIQGMGLGTELLADTLRRRLAASQIAGPEGSLRTRSMMTPSASICCRSKRLGLCLKTNHCVCLGQA
jgi:hypothetical protein